MLGGKIHSASAFILFRVDDRIVKSFEKGIVVLTIVLSIIS